MDIIVSIGTNYLAFKNFSELSGEIASEIRLGASDFDLDVKEDELIGTVISGELADMFRLLSYLSSYADIILQ